MRQMDLLEWVPPAPVARFDPAIVRSDDPVHRLALGVSATLRDASASRSEIAERMSVRLGRRVSLNVLNSYASAARETAIISVPRFEALMHATADRRLLQLLAEPCGWTVIERSWLPLIELTSLREHQRTIRRRAKALHNAARQDGLF